jgi:hypothetical protein
VDNLFLDKFIIFTQKKGVINKTCMVEGTLETIMNIVMALNLTSSRLEYEGEYFFKTEEAFNEISLN